MSRFLASLTLVILAALSARVPVSAQPPADLPPDTGATTTAQRGQSLDGDDPRAGQLRLDLQTTSEVYRFDDTVTINFETSRDARVWIFSQDRDGTVHQLLPNAYNRNNLVKGGTLYRIPSTRYDLKAGPPAGRRTITAIAIDARATNPLRNQRFDTRQPFPVVRDARGVRQLLARAAYELDARNRWSERYSYAEAARTVRFEAGLGGVPSGWDPAPTPVPPSQTNRYGQLNVTSSPSRAEVFVDGRYYGRTPITLNLRTGRYDIAIYSPGYQSYTTTKEVLARDDFDLAVRLTPNR